MKSPDPKSILSIDVGRVRVGIAGCDPLGITITPLPAIIRGVFNTDLIKLIDHCVIREVKGLVVGIPLDETGNTTKQSKHCKRYGMKLANALNLPIALVNEHSTTWEVKNKLNLHNDRTGRIDSEVAALLLKQWLIEGPELKPVKMASYQDTQFNPDRGS